MGICKNAGKTSLLNATIRANPDILFGVLSTGIDGEDRDVVFNTPKPKVHLPAGSLFCCDSDTLDSHGGGLEVLRYLPDENSRSLWVARALMPLATEITGPSTVSGQVQACRIMLEMGAQKVLVDGSLDRKSIALSSEVDATAMVFGASFGTPQAVAKEISRLLMLSHIPVYQADESERSVLLPADSVQVQTEAGWTNTGIVSLLDSDAPRNLARYLETASAIYIPGAVTDSIWKVLRGHWRERNARVVLRHPDCLKLSLPLLRDLMEHTTVQTLIPFRIESFAINTGGPLGDSMDAGQYRTFLRKEFPTLELMDIMEIQGAR